MKTSECSNLLRTLSLSTTRSLSMMTTLSNMRRISQLSLWAMSISQWKTRSEVWSMSELTSDFLRIRLHIWSEKRQDSSQSEDLFSSQIWKQRTLSHTEQTSSSLSIVITSMSQVGKAQSLRKTEEQDLSTLTMNQQVGFHIKNLSHIETLTICLHLMTTIADARLSDRCSTRQPDQYRWYCKSTFRNIQEHCMFFLFIQFAE